MGVLLHVHRRKLPVGLRFEHKVIKVTEAGTCRTSSYCLWARGAQFVLVPLKIKSLGRPELSPCFTRRPDWVPKRFVDDKLVRLGVRWS